MIHIASTVTDLSFGKFKHCAGYICHHTRSNASGTCYFFSSLPVKIGVCDTNTMLKWLGYLLGRSFDSEPGQSSRESRGTQTNALFSDTSEGAGTGNEMRAPSYNGML